MKRSPSAPVLLILAALISGCGKSEETPARQDAPASPTAGASAASAGGVSWSVPERWKDAGERPMRVATYVVPGAGGAESAECGVFYFGSDQGGDIRANIDRWVGQFERPSTPVESSRQVGELKVTLVSTTGTFLSPGGPMMQSQGKRDNYSLAGAIVEAPQGSVFFKMVGPAATVEAARAEFDALLASLK